MRRLLINLLRLVYRARCKLGWHTKTTRRLADPNTYCPHCGTLLLTDPYSDWLVVLKTGEHHRVRAVSEAHARHKVSMELRVHPRNISAAERVEPG